MSGAALDRAVLDRLRQLTPPGGADVLAEVLSVFLDDAPRRVARLRTALGAQDADGVARDAHSLKGSTGNIGAKALQAICRAIEEHARARDLGAVAALIDDLDREFARVEAECAELLGP